MARGDALTVTPTAVIWITCEVAIGAVTAAAAAATATRINRRPNTIIGSLLHSSNMMAVVTFVTWGDSTQFLASQPARHGVAVLLLRSATPRERPSATRQLPPCPGVRCRCRTWETERTTGNHSRIRTPGSRPESRSARSWRHGNPAPRTLRRQDDRHRSRSSDGPCPDEVRSRRLRYPND